MQLVFDLSDERDEERYHQIREQLTGEMREWVLDRFDDVDGERVAAAETFMSWKVGYDDGDLADVSVGGTREFLLEWCPRKVSMPAEGARGICAGLSAYVEFMNATGRLRGGVDRAAEVMTAIADLTEDAVAAMGDRSNFGLGKSLLSAPLTGDDGHNLPDLSDLFDVDEADLQRILQERMDAFNALPHSQRKALTDAGFSSVAPERVELDGVLVLPPNDEVEASIAQHARLVGMIDGLVEWLGEKGRLTTAKGNFKLADARHLVELLATGDQFDPDSRWGREKTRSSEELRTLTLVVDIAHECGAVAQVGNRLTVQPGWTAHTLIERATAVTITLLDIGALTATGRGGGVFAEIESTLDDGVPHWFAGILPDDDELELDEVIHYAMTVIDQTFPGERGRWSDEMWNELIHDDVHRLFGLLELAGLVELHGRETVDAPYGRRRQVGGWFTPTAFARHVMPPIVHAAGYDLVVIPDLASADAASAVAAVESGSVAAADVVAAWRHDQSIAQRSEAVASVAAHGDASDRLSALGILEELVNLAQAEGSGDVEPALRSLLDTPAAAHAALLLIDRGFATHSELGGFVTLGPLVDALSEFVDDPEALVDMFGEVDASSGGTILDDLWRNDQPETMVVLQALGRHLPDKKRAKAARTALNKHRSWVANRNR